MQIRLHFLLLPLYPIFLISCQTQKATPKSTIEHAITLAPLNAFDPNTIDGILATISDQIILFSDLQNAVSIASNKTTQIFPNGKLVGGTLTKENVTDILNSLINRKVLEIKAKEIGITVTEAELTTKINEFLKQQNVSEDQLLDQLKLQGETLKKYRKDFKNEIIKQELVGRVISPLVTVTDDEINSYYMQQTDSTKQISTVKLRSLMVNLPENFNGNPSDLDVIKKIEADLSLKKDFTTLVNTYSMAENAAQTQGLLPPKPLQELPIELQEKLSHLNRLDVVGPLKIGNSVFYFQYLGAEFKSNSNFKANYATWKNKLLNVKFEEHLAAYIKNERSNMRINLRPFNITRE